MRTVRARAGRCHSIALEKPGILPPTSVRNRANALEMKPHRMANVFELDLDVFLKARQFFDRLGEAL